MFYKIPTIIEYVSSFMTLYPGDLFLTGTPSGVGPVKDKDVLKATLKQKGEVIAEINLTAKQLEAKL